MKLLRSECQVSEVVSILMILGSYAGLRWSMEATDSLPLMFNVKLFIGAFNEFKPTMLQ